MNTSRNPSPNAFTLIELLTVIAIIGILAGILVPTVGKVRKTARDSQCKASLRQIGTTMQLFMNDNRGRLPVAKDTSTEGPGFWYVQIAPYLSRAVADSSKTPSQIRDMKIGKLAICPAAFFPELNIDPKGMGASYGWNNIGGLPLYSGVAYTTIPNPSRTIHLAERWSKNTVPSRDSDYHVKPPWSQAPLNSDVTDAGGEVAALRLSHGGKSNYLFFDGHVGSYRPEETYTGSGSATEAPNMWRGI